MNRVCALMKEAWGSLLASSARWEHIKGATYQYYMILDFPDTRTVSNKLLLFINESVWGILLQEHQRIMTVDIAVMWEFLLF
jgi:hypothetical protein